MSNDRARQDAEVFLTPEEEQRLRIEFLESMLNQPRAQHAFAEGYKEIPIR